MRIIKMNLLNNQSIKNILSDLRFQSIGVLKVTNTDTSTTFRTAEELTNVEIMYLNMMYKNLNVEVIEDIEEVKEVIDSILLDKLNKLDRQHWDKVVCSKIGTEEFQEDYFKMIMNLRASNIQDGSVDIERIVNNIYKFELGGYNRAQILKWDFDNNCKADFRKKIYKDLLK